MPRRDIDLEIESRLRDHLENINYVNDLTNLDVLRNLRFYTKGKEKLSNCIKHFVFCNIKEYCEEGNRTPATRPYIKRIKALHFNHRSEYTSVKEQNKQNKF